MGPVTKLHASFPATRTIERRALELLADAGPRGVPETVLVSHGFRVMMLAELISTGLARAVSETMRPDDDREFELALVRITDAGRRALAVD